jgi:hypothetical protein
MVVSGRQAHAYSMRAASKKKEGRNHKKHKRQKKEYCTIASLEVAAFQI